MPKEQASRAQRKLESLLRSGKVLNPKVQHIHVPTHDPIVFSKVKKCFGAALYHMRVTIGHDIATFAQHKIKLVQSKPLKMCDMLNSHISLAKSCSDHVVDIDDTQRSAYAQRKDCVVSDFNWDMIVLQSNRQVQHSVYQSLFQWTQSLAAQFFTPNLVGIVANAVFVNEESMVFKEGLQHQQHFLDQIPSHMIGPVADKDSKRRVLMHKQGYLFRLQAGFLAPNAYFKICQDLSPADVAELRQERTERVFRKKWQPKKRFGQTSIPRCYHNYKTKCLQPPESEPGLRCHKSHSHEREIVSDFLSPNRNNFKIISRALRLVKKLSNEFGWTLWNQSNLTSELHARTSQLCVDEKFVRCCPCGRKKPFLTSFAKVDAAQFFKQASMERGTKRIRRLLERTFRRTGFDAICVSKAGGAHGYLCRSTQKDTMLHRVVTFDDIIDFTLFNYHDRHFALGEVILERQQGWPMGAAISEPATLVDLQESIRQLKYHHTRLQDIKWQHRNWTLEQTVCGLTHVDDTLVISKLWCHTCLIEGVQEVWPKDVGLEPEGTGPALHYLSAWIINKDDDVVVIPYRADTATATHPSNKWELL